MSSVVISGDTSGAVTLTVPAVAGTNTVTVPARTGNAMIDGPAFSANKTTTQSISAGTETKVQYNNKQFDTNNNYDNTTNYRFTPTVAGYYQINASCLYGANTGICYVAIFKNGSAYKRGNQSQATQTYGTNVSGIVYLNGSTDYVEIYIYTGGASTLDSNGFGYFDACLVRGA